MKNFFYIPHIEYGSRGLDLCKNKVCCNILGCCNDLLFLQWGKTKLLIWKDTFELLVHIFHYVVGEMKASSLLSCEVITWLREDDGQLRHLGKQPTMDSMGCKLLRRPGDLTGHKKGRPIWTLMIRLKDWTRLKEKARYTWKLCFKANIDHFKWKLVSNNKFYYHHLCSFFNHTMRILLWKINKSWKLFADLTSNPKCCNYSWLEVMCY